MFRTLFSLLFSFLLCFWSSLASATTLHVSVFDLHPFGSRDAEGRGVGIIPEILQEISQETGLDLNVRVVPYKRMFFELETGDTDFAIFFRTTRSEQIATPKVRVYTLRNIVVGKRGIDLLAYNDLYRHTISVPRGTFYQEKFDNDPVLKKTLVPGFSNAVNQLLEDRAELVAGPEISIVYHLRNLGLSKDILGQSLFLSNRSAWLQVSERSKNLTPETLQILVDTVNKLHQNKIIENIMKKYN
ncbi:transporter substrate-binding domain-containing protein [Kiloniella antarctica]|uniref:Transporter substrate-binding domain-containing protein n=1 Tax=Kiloniella antarctica TaxID=1550907 RepID=A0ABW5BMA6_9PROT